MEQKKRMHRSPPESKQKHFLSAKSDELLVIRGLWKSCPASNPPHLDSSPPYCRFHPQCTRKEGSFAPREAALECVKPIQQMEFKFQGVFCFLFFVFHIGKVIWFAAINLAIQKGSGATI